MSLIFKQIFLYNNKFYLILKIVTKCLEKYYNLINKYFFQCIPQ